MGCNSKQDHSNLDSVIKCTELQKEINSFPDKIETVLGERGITLSGGQKQRVSIARALIKKPSVLIIDNGMSAVDTKTEASLKQNINSWSEANTAVYISHRISTVQDCDSIILLDEGEIVEIGAHQKLINSNDIYSKLFSKQLAVDDNS